MTAYPQAAIPEPYRILGLKLKPFCLGHYLLLQRFDCAFISETETYATREDLLLGVLVCSMSYEEFLQFLDQPDFLEKIKSWGKQVGIFDRKEKAKLFQEYLEKGKKRPAVWFDDDGEESTTHWSQSVKNTLTGELGFTQSEAMNMPLTQAFMDFYKHAEALGVVTFVTPEEEELIEMARRGEAEAKERVSRGS